jgi:hypothetical protein
MDPLALARAIQMLLRVLGVVVLLLGLAFWTGNALGAVPLHMLLGLLLVVCLWALSALAWARARAVGPAIGGLVLGAVVIWFGYQQTSLLPGANHWLVQVVHALLGVGAVGLGEMLGGQIRRAAPGVGAAPA